jgi:hypothetical protein
MRKHLTSRLLAPLFALLGCSGVGELTGNHVTVVTRMN